jgi:hypothetical protein
MNTKQICKGLYSFYTTQMDDCPDELLVLFMSFCSVSTLRNLSVTNHRWNGLIEYYCGLFRLRGPRFNNINHNAVKEVASLIFPRFIVENYINCKLFHTTRSMAKKLVSSLTDVCYVAEMEGLDRDVLCSGEYAGYSKGYHSVIMFKVDTNCYLICTVKDREGQIVNRHYIYFNSDKLILQEYRLFGMITTKLYQCRVIIFDEMNAGFWVTDYRAESINFYQQRHNPTAMILPTFQCRHGSDNQQACPSLKDHISTNKSGTIYPKLKIVFNSVRTNNLSPTKTLQFRTSCNVLQCLFQPRQRQLNNKDG